MKTMKRIMAVLFALMLTIGAAQAGSLSLSGTVEAGETIPVCAPIGGTVETVSAEKGMRVSADDTLFSYRTEKVYATEDGTVTGVFVQAGDDAETVTEKYGADLYIEGAVQYTVSGSTSRAYSTVENTFVHVGETVYLQCRSNENRTGVGLITAVDGTDFTVMVTEGKFILGDSVSIFRTNTYDDKQRVGRGSISRVNPTAVTTTGAVASVAVKDGDQVRRGDLLLETLTGTFDGYEMTGTAVTAAEEGVITSVSAEAGATVTKGDVLAKIAPISSIRVEAAITADDRMLLKAGDKVTIELEAYDSREYEGTVKYITEIPEEDTEEVTYKAIIDFTPEDDVYFGMPVVVTYAGESDSIDTAEPEMTEEAAEPETTDAGE